MIEQQFGEQEVCFRTLDLYTSAVLEASLSPAPQPKKAYRDIMETMSQVQELLPERGFQWKIRVRARRTIQSSLCSCCCSGARGTL